MSEPSPLEKEIRRLIAVGGPMPIARYMSLCLAHPQYGYYVTRDPFGAGGDFTTAPEVSQIFGELLGLWALSVWRMMDEPEAINLIELGPGRGTMMRDALRAAKVLPKFRQALSVHMVEISPTLEQLQRNSLSDSDLPLFWHRNLLDVPEGPSHHSGERIYRRAAGASGGEAERRLARAGDRSQCQWRFRARPCPRCAAAIRPLHAEENQGGAGRSDL